MWPKPLLSVESLVNDNRHRVLQRGQFLDTWYCTQMYSYQEMYQKGFNDIWRFLDSVAIIGAPGFANADVSDGFHDPAKVTAIKQCVEM